MPRPLCGLLYRSLAGAWRRKILTISVFSLLVISTFLFGVSVRRIVEEASLKECSLLGYNITYRGPIEAQTGSIPVMSLLVEKLSPNLEPGGQYSPTTCRARHKVAVIVPHRDRRNHLRLFLQHMHPFLQRQNIEYVIVVVEQAPGSRFNRALLMNVGFAEMSKRLNLDCFIFHDVDLLPLDDRIFYFCMDQPLHLSMVVDTLGDSLMYKTLFGGAVALTPAMMRSVNGFSNLYFGWGGEDDDMSYRIRRLGMSIQRYGKEVAQYTMIKHPKEDSTQWDTKKKLEAGKRRIHEEGLNSLRYKMLSLKRLPLYTWIYVSVDEKKVLEEFGLEETTYE